MPTAMRDVRSQGQSGKHILAVSLSGFDPTETFELSGNDEVVLTNLVYVVGMLKGDYERGLELADRALALNQNLSHAWNARGTMSVILGEYERALDAFEKAARLNPLDQIAIPFTLFGMAAASFLLGRRSFCARVRLRGADRESLVGHARLRWTEDGPNSDAQ
jgi:tetratricopeptide (TPR) repeat protein